MVEKQSEQPAWKQKLDAFERKGPLERLGLQERATKADAKAARNEILKRFHSDLGAPDTPFNRGVVTLINEAYEYISGKEPLSPRSVIDQRPRYSWEKHRSQPAAATTAPRDPFGKREVPNDPKDIKRTAVEEAHKGPGSFHVFVRDLKDHGVANADALLRDPDVTHAILSEALKLRFTHNEVRWHIYYGSLMESWAQIGLDRKKIDADPRVLSRIYRDVVNRIGEVYFPVQSFDEALTQWERSNPAFGRAEFLASADFKRAVQGAIDEAKALDKRGETSILKPDNISWFDRLVRLWKERAHIDILSLGI